MLTTSLARTITLTIAMATSYCDFHNRVEKYNQIRVERTDPHAVKSEYRGRLH